MLNSFHGGIELVSFFFKCNIRGSTAMSQNGLNSKIKFECGIEFRIVHSQIQSGVLTLNVEKARKTGRWAGPKSIHVHTFRVGPTPKHNGLG